MKKIVLSYSHKDEALRREIVNHLAPLRILGVAEAWFDQNAEPGLEWRKEIERQLREADLILLLVSAAYFASEHCRAEMELALEMRRQRRVKVVAIRLYEVAWEGMPIADLQTLPSHGGPVSAHLDRQAILAEIAREIRRLVSPPSSAGEPGRGLLSGRFYFFPVSLLARIRSLIRQAGLLGARAEARVNLLCELGLRLKQQAQFQDARPLLEEALQISREAWGPADPRVVPALNALALVRADMGELETAGALIEEALLIHETGPSDPEALAALLGNRGHILREAGDLHEAQEVLERAVDLSQRLNAEAPGLAIRLDQLANVLREMGEIERARQHAERALDLSLALHGKSHPATALRCNTLGLIDLDRGEPSAAQARFEETLAVLIESWGAKHPSVAAVRSNLALAFRAQGDLETARHQAAQALVIDLRTYGRRHRAIAFDLNQLGVISGNQGKSWTAGFLLRRAAQVLTRALQKSHPAAVAAQENLRALSGANP